MALANFFDRTAQALGQALRAPSPEALTERLQDVVVGVAFDDDALALPNTRAMLELSVNLLSRLYPALAVWHDGEAEDGKIEREGLIRLARAINPDIDIVADRTRSAASICVGSPEVAADTRIYIVADAWNVEVALDSPGSALLGGTFNPLAAGAAACLGAGEVFKAVFSDLLPPGQKSVSSFVLSLLNYSGTPSPIEPLPPIRLNGPVLAGLGAIGNAVVWALGKLQELTGSIIPVDDECVDLSNLQRYVLATQAAIGSRKTTVVEQHLIRDTLVVQAFPMKLGEYAARHNPKCLFEALLVAIDNAEERIAAQALLPRALLNAWTSEGGHLGISRHWFFSPQACLACLHLVSGPLKSRTQEISEFTGLDHMAAANMIVKKEVLTRGVLEEIAEKTGHPIQTLLRWEGQTLDTLYAQGACGGMLIRQGDAKPTEALVPLAHQSALAGILLATELVKLALGRLSPDSACETRMNALQVPGQYLNLRRSKNTTPKCICQDEDYLLIYRKKYGGSNRQTQAGDLPDAPKRKRKRNSAPAEAKIWS